jgi:starch synthase
MLQWRWTILTDRKSAFMIWGFFPRRAKYDCVEIWLAVLSVLLRNIPVVSTLVIPRPNVGEGLPDWVVIAAHKILAFGSDVIVVNGESQVSLVRELYRVAHSRVVYVPLCPRSTAVKWSRQRNAEEPGTVLFFGAARPHKGLEYLVRAQPTITGNVPRARILIASRGDELQRCKQMIHDESVFEIHEGYIPGDVMARLFQRASLIVLPYLSASTSGILMTAYGFGKPVVATRVGSLPEYVDEGVTGLLIPPADVEKLAAAIIRLLSDDDQRHKMGRNARHWVSEERKRIALKTIGVYEKTIAVQSKD